MASHMPFAQSPVLHGFSRKGPLRSQPILTPLYSWGWLGMTPLITSITTNEGGSRKDALFGFTIRYKVEINPFKIIEDYNDPPTHPHGSPTFNPLLDWTAMIFPLVNFFTVAETYTVYIDQRAFDPRGALLRIPIASPFPIGKPWPGTHTHKKKP